MGSRAPPPLQQALEAVNRISKSFTVKLCTEARPELGALLIGEWPGEERGRKMFRVRVRVKP